MSDVSQGPGWWVASDGKWYPPQEHPDARTETETETETAPAAVTAPASRWLGSSAAAEPAPPSSGAGDAAPGSAPEGPAVADMAPPPWSPADAAPLTTTDDPRLPGAGGHGRTTRSPRFWLLGALLLVALAVAALIVALQSSPSSSTALQSGTATITVSLPRNGSPSFSGTVDGRPLTGVISSGGATGSSDLTGTIFVYQGRLGTEPYLLHVSFKPTQSSGLSFAVTGTYGSEPVTATARFVIGSETSETLTVPFSGRVGTQSVSGQATATASGGRVVRINATLNVGTSAI